MSETPLVKWVEPSSPRLDASLHRGALGPTLSLCRNRTGISCSEQPRLAAAPDGSEGETRVAEFLIESARQLDQLTQEIRRLAPPQLRARVDMEDLAQTAYTRALSGEAGFLGTSPPQLECWFRRIVVRTVLDELRYQQTRARWLGRSWEPTTKRNETEEVQRTEFAALDRSPEEIAVQKEELARARLALSDLRPVDKLLLAAVYLDGAPVTQVARALRISNAAAYSRLKRAKNRLRRRLESHSEESL